MLCTDLNWLPTSIFKGITYPKVVYIDSSPDYGGFYEAGTNILTCVYCDNVESTIAHELRHYLQWINGWISIGSEWKQTNSYEESIKSYFTRYPHEMDALLFEYKHSKSWLNEWWLRKLVLNK